MSSGKRIRRRVPEREFRVAFMVAQSFGRELLHLATGDTPTLLVQRSPTFMLAAAAIVLKKIYRAASCDCLVGYSGCLALRQRDYAWRHTRCFYLATMLTTLCSRQSNALARGASDDSWRDGCLAPDHSARPKCFWHVRGPFFLRSRVGSCRPHPSCRICGRKRLLRFAPRSAGVLGFS
jgi:hypothetical protein